GGGGPGGPGGAGAGGGPGPAGGGGGGAAEPGAGADDRGYFALTRDLWVSLVLVLPLLALYGIGVLIVDLEVVNGVDFLTRYVFAYHGKRGVLLLNLGVLFVFFAAIIRLGHEGRFRPRL